MENLYKEDLFKKLQEIKQWQAQQQEKLLIQQKEQQEVLVKQHKKTMEMLGLKKNAGKKAIPFKEFPFNPVFEDNIEKVDSTTSGEEDNAKGSVYSDFDKENLGGNASFDDVPVKPVQKDFKELLEEKIKTDESGITTEGARKSTTGLKPKKTFLKKGEGLKRFRMKPDAEARKKCLSQTKKSPTTTASSLKISSQKERPENSNHGTSIGKLKGHDMCAGGASASSDSTTWANVLTQKNNTVKENECRGAERRTHGEDKKNKYEGVDLEVFELLEQMAGDSSFCSTSSTLLGFMESPVISTPLKSILEKKEHSSKSTKQLPYGMDTSGEDSDDSKGDFDSSSDSCYSESHKAASSVVPRAAPQGAARVHFSNYVEEREFDPSVEDSSIQESPKASKEKFRDTEAWSDNESNSGSDDDTQKVSMLPQSLEAKEKLIHLKTKTTPPMSIPENIGVYPLDSKEESDKADFKAKQDPSIVFKSELLRQRMLELEHEIEKFRRENEKLDNMKKLHEQAHAQWLKEKKETEKNLHEKEEILKNTVLEERKKFNREKQVFEKYCKDLRNQPTKQEREEVQSLQQKLSALQQEMRQKESRNSAAQARITTRLKTIENENLQLKEEVEKLKKEKQLEAKKYQYRLSTKPNTKSLHSINNQLTHLQNPDREQCVIIQDVVPTKPIPSSLLRKESKAAGTQQLNRNKLGKPQSQRSRTVGTARGASSKNTVGQGSSLRRIHSVPDLMQKETTQDADFCKEKIKDDTLKDRCSYDKDIVVDNQVIVDEGLDGLIDPGNVRLCTNFDGSDLLNPRTSLELGTRTSKNFPGEKAKESETINKSLLEIVCDSLYPGAVSSSQVIAARTNLTQPSVKVYPLEKINADGSREIRYDNGNFKRISPDGSSSKLFYYNGDVKESLDDGTVKYYYSETRTWHTTFSDGLEVLEFPNGQVERHCKGTTEVSFPDGTIRLIHPNGKEEVMLPDGTMATIEPNGDQLIQLPNGQKEYQTKQYKKRVYPDGTVKILYSDGIQETRYANGRVRLKDADGNLVMDQNPEVDDS